MQERPRMTTHSAKHVSVLHHTWRGKTACNCVCVDDWIVSELDVGRGFGLCTQGLNDGTLGGGGTAVKRKSQTDTYRYSCTQADKRTNKNCITQQAPLTFP